MANVDAASAEATAPLGEQPEAQAPYPGSHAMPRWDVGELPPAPIFTWRSWPLLLGPGLVMGASAIGGGEWLTGPLVTARYGGALLWLATLSILGQVLYNIEISRYTLYSGEPIFTGKFRTLPGPLFWLTIYLVLDFGSVLPYLASNAATPLATMILGRLPDLKVSGDVVLMKGLACGVFLTALLPLIFGGKIYNSLKVLMSFKLVFVMGFLLFLALLFSTPRTWWELIKGFVSFGNVPVQSVLDEKAAAISVPQLNAEFAADPAAANAAHEGKEVAIRGRIAALKEEGHIVELDGEGGKNIVLKAGPDGFKLIKDKLKLKVGEPLTFSGRNANISDGVVSVQPQNVANVFKSWFSGATLPPLDFSMLGILAAMAAISGNGGLTNTPISNYTRDQGWGMGKHVGAIPSIVARHTIKLSHVGVIFLVTSSALKRWFGWMRHVEREQLAVWMPACFIGLALPSMLSLQFLPRGTVPASDWLAASMTADGVADAMSGKFGASWGPVFWYLTLGCGLLILSTAMAMTADGCLRRWVDVFWTASPRARRLGTDSIGWFYFVALCVYVTFGLTMLLLMQGGSLLVFSTMLYNYALGFSCFHVVAINTILLPKQLRPAWWRRVGLVLAGTFFMTIAVLTTIDKGPQLVKGIREFFNPPPAASATDKNR